MPKKKLTSRQVAKLMKEINIRLFKLFEDKFAYGSKSFVPLSPTNILKNFTEPLGKALARMK